MSGNGGRGGELEKRVSGNREKVKLTRSVKLLFERSSSP